MSATWALALDTAGPIVGLCLATRDGRCWSWQEAVERGADAALAPRIAAFLAEIDPHDPGVVAVVNGPGAFTGLRVGVALALGVALARQTPVMVCSSLLLRAATLRHPHIVALLDARKGRAYVQRFDGAGALPVALGEAEDIHPSALSVSPGFVAVGQGAIAFADWVAAAGGQIAPEADRVPVECLAALALDGALPFASAEAVGLAYLREPDITSPRAPAG